MSSKFCKHCGETIDIECIICPKCGKQVEEIKGSSPENIIINNSSSSSASATTSNSSISRKLPWYLSWFWILILGAFTGGFYLIIGFVLRVNWKSKN